MLELIGAGSERAIDLVGIASAIALVLLVRWLLPAPNKKLVRQPAAFLAIALAFGVAGLVTAHFGDVERITQFFYTFFLLASIGRSLVLLAVDVVFGRQTHRAPPRIFRDVTQAVIYVVVMMLTLRAIGVEPESLLTTSALLTAVVGLALQDTLGNMVSGLALQMQRPFEVGDWIQFEQQIGKVTEVNWRATTVMTHDLVEMIVPNAMLARQPVRNYSRPSKISRRMIVVQGAYDVPPKRVHAAIGAALAGTPGVLVEPPPYVVTRSFADSGIEYGVYYFTDDFALVYKNEGAVRDRIWYALQRASIEIPFPTRVVSMRHVSEETESRARSRELERRDEVLRCVDFLDVLPPEAHRALADAASVRLYAPGEVVCAQGDRSSELFIIVHGDVVVELTKESGPIAVARLGPKKFFGEMGLMTGEVRTATVRATTECELMVIDHDAFHSTLAAVPGVVEKMSDLLAERQAELEAVASSRPMSGEPAQDRSKRLISQIKDFFKL